jgi:hypothetical protein
VAHIGRENALIVFRSADDVEKFREHTGMYPTSEGFEPVGLDHVEIARTCIRHGPLWLRSWRKSVARRGDLLRPNCARMSPLGPGRGRAGVSFDSGPRPSLCYHPLRAGGHSVAR